MNSQTDKDFFKALLERHQTFGVPVIPDIKLRSPKEGDLMRGRDPVDIAKALAAKGAPVLSVVTEPQYFGGSGELMRRIVSAVSLPVLRKDFIQESGQLKESMEMGASAVLLIASMLSQAQLVELVAEALQLGLEPLVETHSIEEIHFFDTLGLNLVGINNRNILELEMDEGSVSTSESLLTVIKPGNFVISESSIASASDVKRAAAAGAHAVLVGTAILQAEDPASMYHMLSEAGRRK